MVEKELRLSSAIIIIRINRVKIDIVLPQESVKTTHK